MSLIQCSECGREVSDQATSCPGCGAPTKNTPIAGSKPKEATPTIGIVAAGLGFASILMPYFAAVLLVPAAFICGVIAYRRGQQSLGAIGIVLAMFGVIGIFAVSQQIRNTQEEFKQKMEQSQKDLEEYSKKAQRDSENAQAEFKRLMNNSR